MADSTLSNLTSLTLPSQATDLLLVGRGTARPNKVAMSDALNSAALAATTAAYGVVLLAPNGGTTAGTVVQANDSRLTGGGGGGVTSLAGTANQISVSAATGAVTLSLPSTLTAPGTLSSNGNLTAGNGSSAIEVRAVGDSTAAYGYTLYTGGTYEASLRHTATTGLLKLDVGRNSTWGGAFEIYADTTRAARFTKTAATIDGTLTLGSYLQTGGYARINGLTAGTNTYLQLWNGASTIGLLGSRASIDGGAAADVGLYVYGANNLTFWTNSAIAATVSSNGNLLIGGTTDISGNGGLKVFGTTNSTSAITGALIVGNGTNGGIGVSGRSYFAEQVNSKAFESTGGPTVFDANGGISLAGNGGSAYAAIKAYTNAAGTEKTISFNQSGGAGVNIGGIGAVAGGSLLASGTVTASNFLLGTGGPSIASTENARASRQGLISQGTSSANVGTFAAFGTGDYTAQVWVRLTTPTAPNVFLRIGQAGIAQSWEFGTTDSTPAGRLCVRNANAGAQLFGSTILQANTVYCVTAVRASGVTTIYLNGLSNGSGTLATDYTNAIGGLTVMPSAGFIGTPLIYNRALSAAEVLALYEAGAPAQADYPAQVAGTALLTGNNSNFATGVGTWQQVNGAAISASGGVLNVTGSSGFIGAGTENGLVQINNRYRLTFTAASYTGTMVQVMVFLNNGNTFGSYVAGTHTVEFTATVTSYVGFSASSGTSGTFTLDNVTLVPLGVVLAPDANQPGSGNLWYDTSGNSATITLPASGVNWNVRTSGYNTQVSSVNGSLGFLARNNSTGTAAVAAIDLQNENGSSGYSIGLRYFGNSFTQVNAYRANRGLLYGAFDLNFLSGQYKFWFGGGGIGLDNSVAYEGFNIYGPSISTGTATVLFTTPSSAYGTGALVVGGGASFGGALFSQQNSNSIVTATNFANTNAGTAATMRHTLTAGTNTSTIEAYSNGHATFPGRLRFGTPNGQMDFVPSGVLGMSISASAVTTPVGLINISKSGAGSTLEINADSGFTSKLSFQRATTNRWTMEVDSTDLLSIKALGSTTAFSISAAGNTRIGQSQSVVAISANNDLGSGMPAAWTGNYGVGIQYIGSSSNAFYLGDGTAGATWFYTRASSTNTSRLAIDHVTGNITIPSSTAATSTSLAALVVSGGVGVAKRIYSGEGLNTGGDNDTHITFVRNGTVSIGPDATATPSLVVSSGLTASGTIIANAATNAFRIPTAQTPASQTASGTQGQITWDASYLYVCTSTNNWGRSSLNWAGGGGGSLSPWSTKTSAYTAANGDRLLADTSAGAFTITLPSSPSAGDYIEINDPEETWPTNNLTVARNGSNIDSLAENLVCNITAKIGLTYIDATIGWKVDFIAELGGGTSGSKNVWIPAAHFIPRVTNGAGVDSRELTTNNYDELLFDPGTAEYAQALVIMPSNYNNGTITARFYWTGSGATDGSDDVVWGFQGVAIANDDALSASMGTAVTVTDTVIATNDMMVSAATSAATMAGTPAANKPILVQIYRDAASGSDTYGHDARFLGIELAYASS